MNIGKAIRIARAVRDMSQLQLATKMGVAPSYVSMLEQGTRKSPSAETTRKAASALGCSMLLLSFLGAEKQDLKLISEKEATGLGLALLKEIAK